MDTEKVHYPIPHILSYMSGIFHDEKLKNNKQTNKKTHKRERAFPGSNGRKFPVSLPAPLSKQSLWGSAIYYQVHLPSPALHFTSLA